MTVTCPFGIRAAGRESTSALKTSMVPGAVVLAPVTSESLTTVAPQNMSFDFEDRLSSFLSPSSGTPAQAQQEDGSFRTDRQTRDVSLHHSAPEDDAVPKVTIAC